MAQKSGIEWTHATWNPIAGCTIVSPGCKNCYAMKMAGRLEAMGQKKYVGLTHKVNGHRVWTGNITLDDTALTIPLKVKKPTTWFVNSMSDLFHEGVPTFFIQKVLRVVEQCPQHIFQVLTKREKRMEEEMYRWVHGCGHSIPQNLWLGVSAEDQKRYDERRGALLRTVAAVRFLSLEPLIGPIDLGDDFWESGNRVEWVIVGGESGPGARHCNVEWIRSIVRQCKAAEVSCFVKQLGAKVFIPEQSCAWAGAMLTPHCLSDDDYPGFLVKLKDPKGGSPEEWPDDLRVREMPEAGKAVKA